LVRGGGRAIKFNVSKGKGREHCPRKRGNKNGLVSNRADQPFFRERKIREIATGREELGEERKIGGAKGPL